MNVENNHRRPLGITAFLCVVFTIPFGLVNMYYMPLYSVTLLAVFSLYGCFLTAGLERSPLQYLQKKQPLFFYCLVVFLLMSFVSLLLVLLADNSFEHKLMAGVRYIDYVLLTFYCFVLARLYILQKVSATQIFMMIVYGCLALIVLFAYVYFIDGAPNVQLWPGDPPTGTNLRMTGNILSVAIVTCVIRIYFEQTSRMLLYFLYGALFVLSAFLIWTASRINVLAVMLTLLVLLILMRVWLKASWRKILPVIIVFFLSFPVGEYTAIAPWGGLSRMFNSVAENIDEHDALNAIGSSRIDVWTAAIKAGMDKPIFGQGPYGYYFSGYAPACCERTHNVILHFFVEFGLIGVLFISTFLFVMAYFGFKCAKQALIDKDIPWLIAAAVVLVLTISSFANRAYEFVISVFLLCSAFAVFPFQRKVPKPHQNEGL